MDRTRRDRMLELKFLGSGLTTAAAKKKFTQARKVVKDVPPVGRAGARAAGMDARLANANKYLTQRAKRGKVVAPPVDVRKLTADYYDELAKGQTPKRAALAKISKLPRAQVAAFYKEVTGRAPAARKTAKQMIEEVNALHFPRANADVQAHVNASYSRNAAALRGKPSIMDNTDAFSAKRKRPGA